MQSRATADSSARGSEDYRGGCPAARMRAISQDVSRAASCMAARTNASAASRSHDVVLAGIDESGHLPAVDQSPGISRDRSEVEAADVDSDVRLAGRRCAGIRLGTTAF